MTPPIIAAWLLSALPLGALSNEPPATTTPPSTSPELGEEYDLTELSLEALMDIQVTVATRSSTPMSEIPAAVYVLTGDEIRRSGHSSIPEALRMVPGMHVSRWTTGDWDVTARGFGPGLALTNLAYLNQLLVMIDGVVVYSPLFAGMFWSLQDVVLEDVDRIEIVRGPGGVLWGSNAVHGVIHIITKHTDETEGLQVTYRTGRDDRHQSVRFGGKFGKTGSFRVWAKGAEYDTNANPYLGFEYGYNLTSIGGRADWKGDGTTYAFWGRAYTGKFDELGFDLTTFDPIQVEDSRYGGQIFGSVTNDDTGARLQAWYTQDDQDLPTLGDIHIDVYDVEYQRPYKLSDSNTLSLGVGYRRTVSRLSGDDPFWYDFDPYRMNQDTYRVFATDTVAFNSLDSTLTLGVAAEDNEFTGFEIQPTIRYAWTPQDNFMMWGGISRAVRTPSLEERTLTPDSFFAGNDMFRSETLFAYELGVRGMPTKWATADLALYFNDYDDLHYRDPSDPAFPAFHFTNEAKGESMGGELAVDFQLMSDWKLRTAYAYEDAKFQTNTGIELSTDGQSPAHMFNVRSYYNITDEWEFDTGFYLVDGLGDFLEIAEYARLDARLGWNPHENFRCYLGIQDAFNETRSELDEFDVNRQSVYFGITFSH
ncbi:MAG: iron complex outermembrane receptor protein [Chlamydiales bacterium]|jgi:iron complex outermembrane receptor protein